MVDDLSIGILRLASVDFFTADVSRSVRHLHHDLSFREVGASDAASELHTGTHVRVLQSGEARFAVCSPVNERSEINEWLTSHPEGVGRISMQVADVAHAYRTLVLRGATPLGKIEHDAGLSWFDIVTPIGSTTLRFVEQHDEAQLPIPGVKSVSGDESSSFVLSVDHLTCNFLTLKPALMWMEQVLGFERYWGTDFHTQDVAPEHEGGSGLRSVVMWDPGSGIKFANNEPAAPRFKHSQIYSFLRVHRGAGVQHVALATHNLVEQVARLRARGLPFMPTPGPYYDALQARLARLGITALDGELPALRENGVLVDGSSSNEYLLQIFMQEAATQFADPSAGPCFIELIERKGAAGFGEGNFRALFESIEHRERTAGAS